jgi:hypothetical protein
MRHVNQYMHSFSRPAEADSVAVAGRRTYRTSGSGPMKWLRRERLASKMALPARERGMAEANFTSSNSNPIAIFFSARV